MLGCGQAGGPDARLVHGSEGAMDDQQTPAPGQPPVGWSPPPRAEVPGAPGFTYADVPNRVVALIIDAFVLVLIGVVIGIVLAAIGLSTGGLFGAADFSVGVLVYAIVGILVNAGYFIWSWTSMRATFGMKALGMQVGNAFDGKTLTMDQALRRAVALWGPSTLAQFLTGTGIGTVLGILALGWVIYLLYTTATSPTKQGFHDTFANSVVVKASRVV
jgi:uncharacterized RDD family membrane protein YckC